MRRKTHITIRAVLLAVRRIMLHPDFVVGQCMEEVQKKAATE